MVASCTIVIEDLYFCVFLITLKASTLVDGYLLGIKNFERYFYEFSQIYEAVKVPPTG